MVILFLAEWKLNFVFHILQLIPMTTHLKALNIKLEKIEKMR